MTHPKLQGTIAMFTKLIRAIVAVTTTCLIIWGGNARAEILITTAAISRGELTIVGRVRRSREPSVHIKISPNKTVQVESSSTGGFRWIGPEFPSTCIVEISSGGGQERSGDTKLRTSRTSGTARTSRSSGA
jgi:hypothetical protein